MRNGENIFNKGFALFLVFGCVVCLGTGSLRAEPSGEVLVVAQATTPQPREPATTPPSAPPQASTTQAPPGPQPAAPASPPALAPSVSPETSVSPPSTTIPPPAPRTLPPSQRRRLPAIPQQQTSPMPQIPTPAPPLPPPSTQAQPSVPAPSQEPAPVVPGPPSAATRPSPQPGVTPVRAGSGVVFNFDNADIYEVIRVMSEILKINYIIDPRVKGVVNIHTSGQISSADVFPIFQSILRLNGATAVKRDGIYEIVPLPEAKKLPISPSSPQDSGKPASDEKYIIQILSLKYVPVTEVSKMIKPFLSDGADIVENPPSNILIIGDLASNVKKSVDIINLFDIDVFTDLRVRIYPVLNADVVDVAKEMEKIFSSFEVSTKSGRGVGITFTPIARINSLLAVSSIPNIFEKVEAWLRELDKIPVEGTKYSVFVYHCQNAKAKDLAEVLKQVYVPSKEKKAEGKEKPAEQVPRGVRPPPAAPTAPAPTPTEGGGGGVPEGEINVVVDETNNALVVRAFARDYRSIVETIRKLDIYPRQVLIDVLLADIGLTDNRELGIDFVQYQDSGKWQQLLNYGGAPPGGTGFPGLQAAGPGLVYAIDQAGRFAASIRAAATEGRAKIITSPNLLASNNKEAKIQIGTSEPILTNTYTSTGAIGATAASTGFVEGTIEYKDIGTILGITPRISDGGLVTLELSIEDSSLEQRTLGRQTSAKSLSTLSSDSSSFVVPAFKKTTAKTILSIKDGQTIALGGLIRKEKGDSNQGLPLLAKIPLLGFLFGKNTYTDIRRELILLLTPHVITDENQSKTVTDEFKDKIEGLKREFEKNKK